MKGDVVAGDAGSPSRVRWIKFIVLAAAALIAVIVLWTLLPVAHWIDTFRLWVADQGLWGHVVFALVYAIAAVCLAPGALLTLAAGLAFGLAGFPTVIVGATLGAGAAFLVGRTLARGWVERQTADSPLFQAVDRAIEADGWKIVGLMRLSPLVPFNLQNYFFGITKVGFWPYLVTTFFGIMPGTLLYVWLGSLGGELGASGGQASTLKYVFYGVGLLATLAVTIIVSRKAKQKLEEAGVESKAESLGRASEA